MKEILFYYSLIVFSCFTCGVLTALAVCISPWCLLGLLVCALLVSISTIKLFDSTSKHLLGTTLLALFGFLFFTVLLILGAIYVNEETFFGIMYVISVTLSLFLSIGILLRLHTKWQLKNYEENQYRTWYWFFCLSINFKNYLIKIYHSAL